MTLCCCSRCHCRSTLVLLKLFAILNFNFTQHSVKILLFKVKKTECYATLVSAESG